MRNLLIISMIIFCLYGCQKHEIEPSIKQIFESLPELESYNSQGPYELFIDTLNSNPAAYYYRVSGKLFYQKNLIWQADSTYLLNLFCDNNLLFLKNTLTPVGTFNSYLFYSGEDIGSKIRPNNFPLISEVRIDGNLIYLSFGDYGTFRRHEKNLYARYDLSTGKFTAN